MESGAEKLRKEIAKRYEKLCQERGVPRHDKLYLNLVEPLGSDKKTDDKGEPTIVSISLIYRGNYKMYFNNRIKDQDFELFCEVLVDFADLVTHIDFSFNEISDKPTKAFAKVLESAVKLESLNMQYNFLGPTGCQNILDALTQATEEEQGTSPLVYLNLEGNDVYSEGLLGIHPDDKLFDNKKTTIERFLMNNRDLIELNLSNNKIDEYGMIEVVSQFNSDTDNQANSLAVLVLDNPYFSGPSQTTAFHVSRMLQSRFCNIEKLSLRKFNLTDEGLSMICEHLVVREENKLRVLDIGANKITFKGCQALANMLKAKNCVIESLIMNNNRTGYFGARAMADAIAHQPSDEYKSKWVHLDMTTNDITDDGLFLIAQALKQNSSLISVKLYYNHFGEKSKKEFFDLLRMENPDRMSDWFLDFTIYKVEETIQIAYVDNHLPKDLITVAKRYYVAPDLV